MNISNKEKIKFRIRKKIKGSSVKPRLSVFRSNRNIFAQLIDDKNGVTLTASSSADKDFKGSKATKIDIAKEVGQKLASKASALQIENCVFDRNGNLYHGRVKSLAEGAREGGLKF
ncbi:MAG: 50S ribosomal protein L18 [Alphaproteobacteria bacterium]|nr:50S ribosomal protein L18 [Alphaproteobacteria bacterium]